MKLRLHIARPEWFNNSAKSQWDWDISAQVIEGGYTSTTSLVLIKGIESYPPSSNLQSAPKQPSQRERGLLIKKAQEEALARLPIDTLFIVLYIRNDPPQLNDFHWGYYLHTSPRGGVKYHVRGIGSGWIPDHGERGGGVFKSNFLCVHVEIANVPSAQHALLDQIMRSHDADVNSIPGITRRVRLLTILEELAGAGLVRCGDIGALQEECMAFGNWYSDGAARNEQPRPVVRLTLCG
ncbi:hypothetical protein BJY00DRAFT_312372 [Aspergillus carlsbadensis]|nr:hypothetical protein BJY00DRAFT_312372 [Aspergillus carlsbadensis]